MAKVTMDTDLNLLANRIKEIRNSLNLNQKEFAERIKISKGYLSEIENGKYSPGFAFIYNLAKEFNVSLDYLFFGHGNIFAGELKTGRPAPTRPDIKDILSKIDPDNDMIHQMFDYMVRSPLVKHSILAFFSELLSIKKDIIEKSLDIYNPSKEDNSETHTEK